MNFLGYENFLNERYYSQNHNLYKVANSPTPILGKPIFTESDNQSFFATRRKLVDSLKSYDEHMKSAQEKMEKFIENAKTKYDKDRLIKANDTRNKAYDIVKRASEFMNEFNKLYDSLKNDLMSKDHVKVANAILELKEIKPSELIKDAGIVKRIRTIKLDSEFLKSVFLWVDSISDMYQMLDEAGKILGKSDKQIEGARKQSSSQRMRWGMF